MLAADRQLLPSAAVQWRAGYVGNRLKAVVSPAGTSGRSRHWQALNIVSKFYFYDIAKVGCETASLIGIFATR